MPTVHVAGDADRIAPSAVREAFASAARHAGNSAHVITIPGAGHLKPMAPNTSAGRAVIDIVRRRLRPARE